MNIQEMGQIHIKILNHISHTCKIVCTKKHNSAEGWKYSKRKQHIYKTNKKQQKNDRTSQCQQILPQRSTVDSVRKDR